MEYGDEKLRLHKSFKKKKTMILTVQDLRKKAFFQSSGIVRWPQQTRCQPSGLDVEIWTGPALITQNMSFSNPIWKQKSSTILLINELAALSARILILRPGRMIPQQFRSVRVGKIWKNSDQINQSLRLIIFFTSGARKPLVPTQGPSLLCFPSPNNKLNGINRKNTVYFHPKLSQLL